MLTLARNFMKETVFLCHFHLRTAVQHIGLKVKMKIGIGSLFLAALVASPHALECPDYTRYSQVCLMILNQGFRPTCLLETRPSMVYHQRVPWACHSCDPLLLVVPLIVQLLRYIPISKFPNTIMLISTRHLRKSSKI